MTIYYPGSITSVSEADLSTMKASQVSHFKSVQVSYFEFSQVSHIGNLPIVPPPRQVQAIYQLCPYIKSRQCTSYAPTSSPA